MFLQMYWVVITKYAESSNHGLFVRQIFLILFFLLSLAVSSFITSETTAVISCDAEFLKLHSYSERRLLPLQVIFKPKINVLNTYLNIVDNASDNTFHKWVTLWLLLRLFEYFLLFHKKLKLLESILSRDPKRFLLKFSFPFSYFLDFCKSKNIFDVDYHGRCKHVPDWYLDIYFAHLTIIKTKRHRAVIKNIRPQFHVF